MKESNILQSIRLAVSKIPGVRVFRNNVAQAWTGRAKRNADGSITIFEPRPLHAGLVKGSGDLVGWKSVVVTPDMLGKTVAVFVSVEAKAKGGRVSDDQKNWNVVVDKAGGISCIARSAEDAETVLKNNQEIGCVV